MLSGAHHILDEDLLRWLQSVVALPVTNIEVVTGGKNNRGLKIRTAEQAYFLKQYFYDDCRRFQRETDFMEVLQAQNVPCIAALLGKFNDTDQKGGIQEAALFSALEGALPSKANVVEHEAAYTSQVAQFIFNINRKAIRQQAAHILPARGGLGLASEFCREIERRLDTFNGLENIDLPESLQPLYDALILWMQESFLPAFKRVEKSVLSHFSQSLHTPFQRVLSPSDIGFHNTLQHPKSQQLSFFDFEYAGWDSAEKLVTDFFAQPRYPLDEKNMETFVKEAFPENLALLENARALLPLAHLKWALIYLNEFKTLDNERRRFATEYQQDDILAEQNRKQQQFDKAQQRVQRVSQWL